MRREPEDDFIDLDEHDEEEEGYADDADHEASDLGDWIGQHRKLLLAGAGAVIILVAAVIFLSSGSENEVSRDDFTALLLRVDRIESRVAQLDGLERAVAQLIETGTDVPDQTLLIARLDALAGKVDELQKNMTSLAEEARASRAAAPSAVVPPQDRHAAPRYHTVRRGETLFGISRSYNVSIEQLLAANNIGREDPLAVGQRLVIPSR